MSIISKIGASIARNKSEVKTILDKYNVPSGGSNSDRIRAAFSSIKNGNTDLAAELSALSSIGGAKTKMSPAKAKDVINQIKSGLDFVKSKLASLKKNPKNSGIVATGQIVPTTVNPIYTYPDPTVDGKAISAENQLISGSRVITDHPIDNSPLNIPDSTIQLSADGDSDPVVSDSVDLVNEINGSDIEKTVSEASLAAKSADLSDTRTILGLCLVAVVIIIAILKAGKFNFSTK
jgi:hypothetical protein